MNLDTKVLKDFFLIFQKTKTEKCPILESFNTIAEEVLNGSGLKLVLKERRAFFYDPLYYAIIRLLNLGTSLYFTPKIYPLTL